MWEKKEEKGIYGDELKKKKKRKRMKKRGRKKN